jgi:toxin secretion/phage lysis holin
LIYLDNAIKIAVGLGGGLASFLWGGWSTLMGILLAFVFIDYATGLFASALEGRLSSKVGFKGIFKKVMIFAIVAVAHLIDEALGGQNDIFRDATIFFYLANELLSILENAGRAGLPIPDKLQNAVDVLKNDKKGA